MGFSDESRGRQEKGCCLGWQHHGERATTLIERKVGIACVRGSAGYLNDDISVDKFVRITVTAVP